MAGVSRAMTQSYHRILTVYYRLSERVAESFNLSARLSLLMLLIAALGCAGIAAAVFYEAWFGVVALMILFVLLPALIVYPELIIICVLLAVASLVSPAFWDTLALGDRGITLPNMLVALGLVIVLMRACAGNLPIRALWVNPTTLAILVFLTLSVPVGLIYHRIFGGLTIRSQLSEMQDMIIWMVYFIIIGIVVTSKTLRHLQIGLLFVALVGSVPTILQAIVGERALFFLKLTEWDIPLMKMEGLVRVLPPGHYLYVVSFLVSTQMAIASSGSKRWGWGMLALIYGLAILMTLTRHSWFGAMLGVGLLWLFGDSSTKAKAVILLGLVVAAIVSLTMMMRPVPVYQPTDFFAKIQRRFLSTFTEDPEHYALGSPTSIGQRVFETRYVLNKFPESPWFGFGWGTKHPLRIRRSPYVGSTYEVRTYIHNSFVWILGKGGLIGIAGLLALCFTGILRGYLLYKQATDQYARAWLLALWVAFLVLLLAAQFEPVFWIRNRIVSLVMVLALMECIHYFSQKKQDVELTGQLPQTPPLR